MKTTAQQQAYAQKALERELRASRALTGSFSKLVGAGDPFKKEVKHKKAA